MQRLNKILHNILFLRIICFFIFIHYITAYFVLSLVLFLGGTSWKALSWSVLSMSMSPSASLCSLLPKLVITEKHIPCFYNEFRKRFCHPAKGPISSIGMCYKVPHCKLNTTTSLIDLYFILLVLQPHQSQQKQGQCREQFHPQQYHYQTKFNYQITYLECLVVWIFKIDDWNQ